MDALIREIRRLIKVTDHAPRRQRSLSTAEGASDLAYGFLHYSQRRPAAWAMPDATNVDDVVNHLLVVVRRGSWVAITLTEGSRRSALTRALTDGSLRGLKLVSPGRAKAAFIAGRARTLWLKGTHRRDSVKADSKVLTGLDLRDALDPIADQTYRYTALRCESAVPALDGVIGVAADQARVWITGSENWDAYLGAMKAALEALEAAADSAPERIPVVALTSADLGAVSDAFDLGITPPELLAEGPTTDPGVLSKLAELEKLAYGTNFEVSGATGSADLTAQVFRDGAPLGEIELGFDVVGDRVTPVVRSSARASGIHRDDFEEVIACCGDAEHLTVYYDSGHTIIDGQVCEVRHRDVVFDGYRWASFDGFDVTKEKPDSGLAIGDDDSLFCWMLAHWPAGAGFGGAKGWLVCDDRPGETCDFIHLEPDDGTGVPLLSLIHVKAAKSGSPSRGVSVVAYETVAGQAVKNIRHLDPALLAEGVSAALPPNPAAVWNDGQPASRDDFLAAVAGLGANIRRRAVILQPHLTMSAYEAAIAAAGADHHRMLQLNSLLAGSRVAVSGMGAEFYVIGEATTP